MNKQERYEWLMANAKARRTAKFLLEREVPKLYKKLMSLCDGDLCDQNLYTYFQPDARSTCKMCEGAVRFKSLRHGYTPYCSPKCANDDPEFRERRRRTLRKNYGVDNPLQSKKIRAKYEKTCKKRYGHAVPSKSKKVKKTARQNLIENMESLAHSNSRKYARSMNRRVSGIMVFVLLNRI